MREKPGGFSKLWVDFARTPRFQGSLGGSGGLSMELLKGIYYGFDRVFLRALYWGLKEGTLSYKSYII